MNVDIRAWVEKILLIKTHTQLYASIVFISWLVHWDYWHFSTCVYVKAKRRLGNNSDEGQENTSITLCGKVDNMRYNVYIASKVNESFSVHMKQKLVMGYCQMIGFIYFLL